jgi:hypothetical protein
MAKTKAKAVSLVGIIAAVLLGTVARPSSPPTDEPATQGMSLEAADALHSRLNYECSRLGTVALYQGALANRLLAGIPPSSYSGRWDVYPKEKVTDDDFAYAPYRARESDRLFSLNATSKSDGEIVELIVQGEKIGISLLGVDKKWRFPQSPKTTVQSLLEGCSDRSWNEMIAKERRAAGLKTKPIPNTDHPNQRPSPPANAKPKN